MCVIFCFLNFVNGLQKLLKNTYSSSEIISLFCTINNSQTVTSSAIVERFSFFAQRKKKKDKQKTGKITREKRSVI
jgi:hypothetical protein